MANYQPYEQGGVVGPKHKGLIDLLQGMDTSPASTVSPVSPIGAPDFPGQGGDPAAVAPPPTTPAASGLGAYASKMGGFDQGKFADPNRSEKYKIGEVMSRFDPRGGVTPEMLKALNDLGIAEFSGQGDQLTVKNTKNDPRFGAGGTADVVKGLKGQNADTGWQPWFVDDGGGQPQPQARQGGGGMPSFDGSTISGMLQSDAQGNIQQALSKLQQPGMLQQLIAALQGGR